MTGPAKIVHFCPGCEAWQQDIDGAAMTGLSPLEVHQLLYDTGEGQAEHLRECPPMQAWLQENHPEAAERMKSEGRL